MVFVPVMWTGYEMACLTQSGRVAIAVTHDKQVQLLARNVGTRQWDVLREWPVDQLSHTTLISHLGDHPEPATPQAMLDLVAPLEAPT